MEKLDVWFDGTRAAELERHAPGEEPWLRYTEDARGRWDDGTPLLSVRLPVQADPWAPPALRPFLAGLLPEGAVRELLFQRAKLGDDDVFGYLRSYGADCAGALSVVEAGSAAPPNDCTSVEWLDEVQLRELVDDLPRSPLGLSGPGGGVKLSLAGVQDKLVLVRRDDGVLGLPLYGHPSTHILKPEPYDADRQGLIVTEAFCMSLSAAAGVPTAPVSVIRTGGRPALLVERYDREVGAQGVVRRVHQEDLCQAAGKSPGLKYERQGGVGWATAAAILERNGAQPFVDLANLLRLATLTVVVGNGDAHAKNISLLHTPAHTLHLASAYDVACSKAFIRDDTLAMKVNGRYGFDEVGREDLVAEAVSWGLPARASTRLVETVAGGAAATVGPLLERASAERWHEPILDEVAAIVRANADRLLR